MRTTLTALLLCGALSSSAQWTLPASPDTIAIRMSLAGDRLVTSGKQANTGLLLMLGGAALTTTAAVLSSGEDASMDTRSATPMYLAGGAMMVVGIGFEFSANSFRIRAGRLLRNKH